LATVAAVSLAVVLVSTTALIVSAAVGLIAVLLLVKFAAVVNKTIIR